MQEVVVAEIMISPSSSAARGYWVIVLIQQNQKHIAQQIAGLELKPNHGIEAKPWYYIIIIIIFSG